jgi:hypothetical protein
MEVRSRRGCEEGPENVRGESPKVYALGGIAYTLTRPQYVAQVLFATP